MLAIRSGSPTTNLEIYKRVGSAWTSLDHVSPAISTDIWYHYKIVLNGNNIKVYFNNNAAASLDINDSTFTSGKIGLRTNSTSIQFDNVVVHSLACTVTFNPNGGSAVSSQRITGGNTASAPPAPTKTGYIFAGWYKDDATFADAYDFIAPIMSNITLYAKWNADTTPVWANTYPKVGILGTTSAQILAKTDRNGKVYYVVLANNAQVPGPAEIKAGTGKDGVVPLKAGSITMTANTELSIDISGLPPHFVNDVYLVAEDDSAVPAVQAVPVKVDINASDVLACYEFENNTNDSSGKGNHATLSGTAAYTAGVNGKAISLSGSTSIAMPNKLLSDHPNFTVIARFKTSSPGGLLGIQDAAAGASALTQFVPVLSIRNDGKLAAELWTDTDGIKVYSPDSVNDNTWHKVAISASPNSITVYLDDIQIGTKTGNVKSLEMYYNQLGSNDGETRAGQTQGWQYFTGLIDDVYVLDGGLTGQEIQQMTNSISLGGTSVTEAAANDGSIAGTLAVNLANSTYTGTDGQAVTGVTVNHLPLGLSATSVRSSSTQLTISFGGKAANHASANSISNATVTVAQALINGASGDVTSAPFAVNFIDPYAYTVTYSANGATGGAVPTDSNTYLQGAAVTVPGNTGHLARTGYTFAGWNTQGDGSGNVSGADRPAASTFVMGSANATLYAKWSPDSYMVTYNGNGNTGGSAPAAQSYGYQATAAAAAVDPGFMKTGYSFTGWNTAPDGSGTPYAAGTGTFTMGAADIALYAQWSVKSYTVTYHGNGNNGGSVPVGDSYPYLSVHTVANNTGSLTKTGYKVAGWNTAADGSGTDYGFGTTFAMPAGALDLYAKWVNENYKVIYNGNGNTAGNAPVDSKTDYHMGDSVTVSSDKGLIRKGYTFAGWNTAANGSGDNYTAGTGSFNMGAGDVFLYAKWIPVDYHITYSGSNNTTGTAPTDGNSYHYLDSVTAASNSGLGKTGHIFAGWNTAADGSGSDYAAGGSLVMGDADMTLYAKWTPDSYTVAYNGNGNTGGTVPVSVTHYIYGSTVSIAANSGLLARAGYTFGGWNTAADGSGDNYAAGSGSFTMGAGNVVLYAKWTAEAGHDGNTPGGSSTAIVSPAPVDDRGAVILVNGQVQDKAAVATTVEKDNIKTTTVVIAPEKLAQKLQAEGQGTVVTIPVITKADVVVGQLNGQMVKNMEQKEAVLEIKVEQAVYMLPASQINIDSVAQSIGAEGDLGNIKVNVQIARVSEHTAAIVQDTAGRNNYRLIVKPLDFNITCAYREKTVEVSRFNGYVERTVALPDNIDVSKITTGIVLNANGTFSHVPTIITAIDGKYYAKINSLTNSTYSVIYHPMEFKDVEKHWAKDAVNDMGSRLVVSGVGGGVFGPDMDITRAEFAAIMVQALGLMRPGTGKDTFSDVSKGDWYYDAVSIAYEYGILSGYGGGKFGPADKITREQAMTMMARAMKITGLTAGFKAGGEEQLLAAFRDAGKVSAWANRSVAFCIKAGIVSGRDGKRIAPKDNITRAEVAVIVQQLLKKSGLI